MDSQNTAAGQPEADGEIAVEAFSARISQLNQDQLEQVFNMLRRQQEATVAENQALGRAIDELKAKKATTAREADKLGSHLQLIGELMTPNGRKAAMARLGAEHPTLSELLAQPGRQDGVAQGVVLDASAQG
jgi:hypothetical protein